MSTTNTSGRRKTAVARIYLTEGNGAITVNGVECHLFGAHYPAGSVGLTAANMDQSGELLGDVLLHMDHYRKRSSTFAARCAEYFNADQIVARLLAAGSAQIAAAAEPIRSAGAGER